MVNDVKAFGKIEKAEKSKFLAVDGGEDVVGYGGERGFGGMTGAETVLGWGKEVVAGHVGIELLLYYFLYDFGEGGDDGNGTIVGRFVSAAGFVDRVNDRVFPGCGKITGCETGVENEEKDVTDGAETKFEDPDAR